MGDPNLSNEGQLAGRVERIFRKFFERLGGTLDFALRRPLNPQVRTDLTVLIPQLERAIDEGLREQAGRTMAPDRIEIRFDYETYSRLTPPRVEYLERELRLSAHEYIHNRRYPTLSSPVVKLSYDMFARKMLIRTSFSDEEVKAPETAQAKPAEPPPQTSFPLVLKSPSADFRLNCSGRLTLGRARDNDIRLDDPSVSSVHAAFTCTPTGTFYLTDLGSSNGTYVNSVAIPMGDKTLVRSGDRIRFGDFESVLELV